jgi:2-oxo-4-hydroxy-4-carboxy-5-ureidoimidazoline decarboxylase
MSGHVPAPNLALLNICSAQDFVKMLDGVFENAPQLVLKVAYARPYSDIGTLHTALMQEVRSLSDRDLVAFLATHPELAGPEARSGGMTANSTVEQGLLNLGDLPDAETERWAALNTRYRQRFGFPFIARVADHDYASLLETFGERMQNDRAAELRIALTEIDKISRHRLAMRLGEALG